MGMTFKEAYNLMVNEGKKIKLPSWSGYWYWDAEKQTIMMYTKYKERIDIRETNKVNYTISNILLDDWIIANEENCPSLNGKLNLSFEESLKYLKKGKKMARHGWNSDNQYIVYINPYANNLFIMEFLDNKYNYKPYLAIKTNYGAIGPWFPSQTDILSDDWYFVNDKEEEKENNENE